MNPDIVDNRVQGYLGQILNGVSESAGTCFQTSPNGYAVTAAHILSRIGADYPGAEVRVAPLRGGSLTTGQVLAIDSQFDLAVLRLSSPLPDSLRRFVETDKVPVETEVVIAGVPDIYEESSTQYQFLSTTGRWIGETNRDSIPLGHVRAQDIMRGMSGAPVRDSKDRVVGVVSSRYTSEDGWLRDKVWIARTEDLQRIISNFAPIKLERWIDWAKIRKTTAKIAVGSAAIALAVFRETRHQNDVRNFSTDPKDMRARPGEMNDWARRTAEYHDLEAHRRRVHDLRRRGFPAPEPPRVPKPTMPMPKHWPRPD